MFEELQQIDTSSIDELGVIKREQELLAGRLAKMDELKEKVSPTVFARVRADYEARAEVLEEQARPLKNSARLEYAKLRALWEKFQASLEAATLDREELEFRHQLGEFQEKEYKERLLDYEARLQRHTAELADARALKEKFLAAFLSPEELEQAPPAEFAPGPTSAAPPELELDEVPPPLPPPSGAPPAAPVAAGMPVEPIPFPDSPPEATPPELPPPDLTLAEAHPPGSTTEAGATIVIRGPALVAQGEDGLLAEFPLSLQVTSIGRSPDNDIRVAKSAVSRKHAKIVFGPEGYTVIDLGSENGTFVNGERVTEHLLKNGDRLLIGPTEFVFSEQ